MPPLICLPPAGAGPGVFRPWLSMPGQIIAPSIPGREARFSEPGAPDLETLADGIADDVASNATGRYGLFGYSMGGTVAVLLAERLRARGLPDPEVVFVLGALPPHLLHEGLAEIAALPSADFWAEIARIGGTPPEILDHAEMRALLEPALRHDFAICGAYRPERAGFRLHCPLYVMVARDDHLVPQEKATEWSGYTTGSFCLSHLPGSHMLKPEPFRHLPQRLHALWPASNTV